MSFILLPLLIALGAQQPTSEPIPSGLWFSVHLSRYNAVSSQDQPVVFSATPVTPGNTGEVSFFQYAGRCSHGAASYDRDGDATTTWRGMFTPLRFEDGALVVKVDWTRTTRANNTWVVGGRGVFETALRTGTELTLDFFPDVGFPARCAGPGTRIALSLTSAPNAEPDRRIIATDVWLVHQAPGRAESAQQLTLRSQVDERVPFYFNDVAVSDETVDVFGDIVLRLRANGQVEIELTTSRRFSALANTMSRGIGGSGATRIIVAPGSVASVNLPAITREHSAVFQGHEFSLRLRPQIVRGPEAGGPPKEPQIQNFTLTVNATTTGADGRATTAPPIGLHVSSARGSGANFQLALDPEACRALLVSGWGPEVVNRRMTFVARPLYNAFGVEGIIVRRDAATSGDLTIARPGGPAITVLTTDFGTACAGQKVTVTASVAAAP